MSPSAPSDPIMPDSSTVEQDHRSARAGWCRCGSRPTRPLRPWAIGPARDDSEGEPSSRAIRARTGIGVVPQFRRGPGSGRARQRPPSKQPRPTGIEITVPARSGRPARKASSDHPPRAETHRQILLRRHFFSMICVCPIVCHNSSWRVFAVDDFGKSVEGFHRAIGPGTAGIATCWSWTASASDRCPEPPSYCHATKPEFTRHGTYAV